MSWLDWSTSGPQPCYSGVNQSRLTQGQHHTHTQLSQAFINIIFLQSCVAGLLLFHASHFNEVYLVVFLDVSFYERIIHFWWRALICTWKLDGKWSWTVTEPCVGSAYLQDWKRLHHHHCSHSVEIQLLFLQKYFCYVKKQYCEESAHFEFIQLHINSPLKITFLLPFKHEFFFFFFTLRPIFQSIQLCCIYSTDFNIQTKLHYNSTL